MKKQQSIAEKLLSYGIMINNSISETEIANALAPFGYTAEVLTQAKTRLEELDALVKIQIKEYGEQYEATQLVQQLRSEANQFYTTSLQIARIAFKNNATAQNALLLNGRRKDSISGWLQQAQSFYSNLEQDNDFMATMANFGYTPEKLAAEKALVVQLEEAKQKQAREKGEAQQATLNRDRKMDEIDEWISDFKIIARIALEAHPQWMEKLGILERS